MLLAFMGEGAVPTNEPTDESSCGACDNCSMPAATRVPAVDYGEEAEMLLSSVQVCRLSTSGGASACVLLP